LKQNSSGFYVDSGKGVTSSIFFREITVTSLPWPYDLQVDCTVTWKDHGRNYSYNLETLLYDWK